MERDVVARQPGARLRVVLLHQEDRLRVLLHDESGALCARAAASASTHVLQGLQRCWSEAVSLPTGALHVERVPGWGVLVLADLPHRVDLTLVRLDEEIDGLLGAPAEVPVRVF